MPESRPAVLQKSPAKVQMEAGKACPGCACGNRKKQPMCDGGHKSL